MSYADAIRRGDVDAWVMPQADGRASSAARASAGVAADELATLAQENPRRAELADLRQAWLDRAALLEELGA